MLIPGIGLPSKNPDLSFDVLCCMKNWQDYIVSDEGVLFGKSTLKGTRLSVDFILGRLADGWTEEQLFKSYPRLTRDHLSTALHLRQLLIS
jgi:uncharacterized protein (DUF433 family)